MTQRVAIYARLNGTGSELDHHPCQTVENRVGSVVAAYLDNGDIAGRGKNASWTRLMGDLDAVDQIVLINAGHIPGKTTADLLKVLSLLQSQDVTLRLLALDTGVLMTSVLEIINAYHKAKLSAAIRAGQTRAAKAGRRIGRPPIPLRIRDRIQAALSEGGGIRPTARRFNVSPASIIAIRSQAILVAAYG